MKKFLFNLGYCCRLLIADIFAPEPVEIYKKYKVFRSTRNNFYRYCIDGGRCYYQKLMPTQENKYFEHYHFEQTYFRREIIVSKHWGQRKIIFNNIQKLDSKGSHIFILLADDHVLLAPHNGQEVDCKVNFAQHAETMNVNGDVFEGCIGANERSSDKGYFMSRIKYCRRVLEIVGDLGIITRYFTFKGDHMVEIDVKEATQIRFAHPFEKPFGWHRIRKSKVKIEE